MKIQLRLEHLLGLDREGHTPIQTLAQAIGISRHKLMHLLDNDSRHINRNNLEAVTEYLLGHGLVNPADLPHTLFTVIPDSFWPMLAARQRIELFMGVRWFKEEVLDFQVFAADAVLQSVIVNRLTGVVAEGATDPPHDRHAQQVIDSQLAICWGAHGATNAEIKKEATSYFKRHSKEGDNRAIVCLGSIKSNAVSEHVIAHAHRRAKAFQSEDDVARPEDRSVPFVIVYKKNRPHPPSCWGALRLSQAHPRPKTGIYFEREPGTWECARWTKLEDAALVFYRFNKARRNLAMVLGGFSGRATRCLAEMLRQGEADRFWPPAVDTDKLDVGAFIVKFRFRPRRKGESVRVRPYERRTETEVIGLPAEVLEHRLASPRVP